MTSGSNQIDLLPLGFNLAVLYLMEIEADMHLVRILVSVAAFFTWWQLLFWTRLFDSTAKYWDLIIQTVIDILPFMGILIVLLLMFNSGLYVIQFNRYLANDDTLFPYEEGLMPMLVAGILK